MKKNVLLIGNFFASSFGARGVCEDLADQLSRNGWKVHTTSRKKGRVARLLDMTSTAWKLRDEYGVAQVDVYSGPAFIWAEAACWALRRAKKPYVLTLHGGDLPPFARQWPGRVSRLLRSAPVVTSPSRYLYDQMKPYRADLQLLPNPLDLTQYSFRTRRKPQPRFIWLRAFHSIYNPTLAPRVITGLLKEFPEIRLTMVGPDKGDGSLQTTQQVAAQLGVANRITFVGGVAKSEVPQKLNEGDIFLNTTNVDNTPVSVPEAMACGLCVVNTNVGGIPYLLESEHDALLVPPDDPLAMIAAVRRILREPGLAERLSVSARRKVENFDWPVILPQWETIFLKLLRA